MRVANDANCQKTRLTVHSSWDIEDLSVNPQFLRRHEIDAVFGFVRPALVWIELEFHAAH